jgi:3-methylfumaryl-CoA hydratase
MELARARAQRPVRAFEFRGQAPLFDLHPFRLEGTPAGAAVELVARAPDGVVAMTARAELDA